MSGVSPDANVERVREALLQRSIVGQKKYGVTTERTDLSFLGWIQHLQEELMDAAIYCERLKDDFVRTTQIATGLKEEIDPGYAHPGECCSCVVDVVRDPAHGPAHTGECCSCPSAAR